MRCSIDSLLIAVRQAVAAAGCAAFVITGNATSAEPEAGAVTARGLERTADDAIAKLVDFLQHPEGGDQGGDQGGASSPRPAPQPNQGVQAGPPAGWGGPLAPRQGGAIVLPPKVAVFSFDVEVGADGKVKQGPGGPAGFTLDSIEGLEGIIARHVQSMQGPPQPQAQPPQPLQQPPQGPQGPHHPGQPHHPQPNQYGQPQFQAPLPPHVATPFPALAMAPVPFDVQNIRAHAHVAEQLDQILGKLDRLEARLGGPSPHGQPPFAPLPHGGPRQSGTQRGGPGPQFHGRMVPPGHQAPPMGGMSQDDLNRRFEEHARDLHRHVEEMARGLGEKLKGAGGDEELRHMHEKLVKTHEQLQDRFQDIRRRFAEQQERIERLEQEVRRLHEAHGVGRAEGEGRERKREEKAKRRDEEKQGATPGANATPNVSYEGEESASL